MVTLVQIVVQPNTKLAPAAQFIPGRQVVETIILYYNIQVDRYMAKLVARTPSAMLELTAFICDGNARKLGRQMLAKFPTKAFALHKMSKTDK